MEDAKKTPLIRLSKRDAMDPKKVWAIRIGSILVALIIGCIPILITGNNPFKAYAVIIKGSLGTSFYFKQTLKNAIPLLGCALAIAPCFKMRFWNIGGEGQITAGAIFASFFAINFASKLPHVPLLLVMGLAAAVGGAIWAAIPGFFKAKYNTNETLFTLMMNYIAIGIISWLQGGPWEGRPGTQQIPLFNKNALLPSVFGLHIGWIIVLVLVALMHIYMDYTKQGYEISVIGDSYNTARYAGMNVGWVMVRTMLVSGAICGIVGFILVSGQNKTITSGVAGGVGFTAITVAWLGHLNAFAMIIISMILAILTVGSSYLQQTLGVPSAISEIVSGILLFSMLGCEFFINYQMTFRSKVKKEVKA